MQVQGWFTNYSNEINVKFLFSTQTYISKEINSAYTKYCNSMNAQVSIFIILYHFYPNWNIFIYLCGGTFLTTSICLQQCLFQQFSSLDVPQTNKSFSALSTGDSNITMSGDSPGSAGNLLLTTSMLTTIHEKCFPDSCLWAAFKFLWNQLGFRLQISLFSIPLLKHSQKLVLAMTDSRQTKPDSL